MARRYLTTAEIAARMRTSPSTIRYWRLTGYLPIGTTFGRRTLYDEDAFEEWEREREAADAAGRETATGAADPVVTPARSAQRTSPARGPSREAADVAAIA